jgi:signal transduction histidine kinase
MVEQRGDAMRFLASRSMPTEWGDTIVYAAEYPAASIDSMLNSVLTSVDLLPPSLVVGHGNLDVFDLEVSDVAGETIFRTRPVIEWEQPAEAKLPDSFGGLRLKAQLRPQVAQMLIIGGVPRSRLPLLLVLLALAVGLTALAAFQLRREVRFAAERSNFVASVSHELRTPLTQVRLVLDTLRLGRGGDAESRDTALRVADREVLRLQHLVEGVLRFSRGSRHNESPRVRTDVAAEARAVVKEFEPLGAPRGVSVEVSGDAEAHASLHNGALRQLLLNLLDNAVKYGRENAKVLVEVHSHAGGGARVAVSDSGPGVAPADRERIWRPFERGSLARSRAVGGSGIGLTIVREIAEEHGGRAWVEDAAGGGARFVVELPDEGS